MEQIMSLAASSGGVENKTKPGVAMSRAEGFSEEMEKAVKKASGPEANTQESKPRAAEAANAAGTDEDGMDDMKETGAEQGTAVGLMSLTAAVASDETAAGAEGGVCAAKSVEAAGAAELAPEDATDIEEGGSSQELKFDELSRNAQERKDFDPYTLPEAELVAEDVNDAVDTADDVSGAPNKKMAQDARTINAESAAHPGVENASGSDDVADLPEGKAGTPAVNAAAADDMDGNAFANGGRESRGGFNNQSTNGTGETVGVGPLYKQEAAYEAVASRSEITVAEKAEVFDKLSTGVRMSIARDGAEVKLSLRPDHLGNLNIKLNIDEGNVSARIIVESAAVKDALDADSSALREVFGRNNLVLDKYTVEVADKGFSFEASTSGFSGFEDGGREGFYNGKEMIAIATDDISAAAGIPAGPRASGIDLFI